MKSRNSIAGLVFLCVPAFAQVTVTLPNFNEADSQNTRFNTAGDAVDAHDGEIALFNGTYYLYGTSYDCGFEWQVPGAPFCGFKVYASPDLVHWTDRGFLFDASIPLWQSRCNGTTVGCYRPHVVFNAGTQLYVLWINSAQSRTNYNVFTSTSPTGPFTETAEPTVSHMGSVPDRYNGDFDLFVDNDGSAFLAFTSILAANLHTQVVERLNASYTSGTGSFVVADSDLRGASGTEAPSLFRNGNTYYLLYGPTCPYCGGTATIYKTAANPLGPWSANVTNINANSCGGQPSFVAAIPFAGGDGYLFGSDLWNNGARNEAMANFFWTPLSFAANGSINPFTCQNPVVSLTVGSAGSQNPPPADLDNSAGIAGFHRWCDIGGTIQRSQSFVASRTGILTSASFTTFQSGRPNAGLEIAVYAANASHQPTGAALSSAVVLAGSIGWSAHAISVSPNIPVVAGTRYSIVVRSTTTAGCYGLEYNDAAPIPGGGAAFSNNSGASFAAETNRTLKFQTRVNGSTPVIPKRIVKSIRGWKMSDLRVGIFDLQGRKKSATGRNF